MERLETNIAVLTGEVTGELILSHKTYGETFYQLELSIDRRSGYRDAINIMISDRLLFDKTLNKGDMLHINGQVRTYNTAVNGKNRLNVVVFAREREVLEDIEYYQNEIYLEGYICKPPIKRTSPLGREICDIMLAVNRMYNKSDYIPCIAWGRNASYAAAMEVGEKICIEGRIQSRRYNKKDSEGNVAVHTAYEVSVIKIDEAGKNDKDEII